LFVKERFSYNDYRERNSLPIQGIKDYVSICRCLYCHSQMSSAQTGWQRFARNDVHNRKRRNFTLQERQLGTWDVPAQKPSRGFLRYFLPVARIDRRAIFCIRHASSAPTWFVTLWKIVGSDSIGTRRAMWISAAMLFLDNGSRSRGEIFIPGHNESPGEGLRRWWINACHTGTTNGERQQR